MLRKSRERIAAYRKEGRKKEGKAGSAHHSSTARRCMHGFRKRAGRFFRTNKLDLLRRLVSQVVWLASLPVPLLNIKWLFYFICTAAAIAGLFAHPFFFAIHMLDIVNFSRPLQNVLRAVTKNIGSLMLTAAFILVWTYLYAVFGLEFFQIDFTSNGAECYDLLSCWLTIIHEGMRSGDVGNSLTPLTRMDSMYYGKMLYAFTFWMVVITIFLNLFFGIIIDTFGELRGAEDERLADENSVCFICGIDRATFDRNGVSFSQHIKRDHNIWSYVHLLVYLRTKPITEYNGWESHIAAMLPENRSDNGDLEFFPMHRALSLRMETEREELEKKRNAELLAHVAERQKQLVDRSEGMSHEQRLAKVQITGIAETLSSVQRELKYTRRSILELENGQRVMNERLVDKVSPVDDALPTEARRSAR